MIHAPPTQSVPERFAGILMLITGAVVKWGLAGLPSLPAPLVSAIVSRLRAIKERVTHLANLINEGKYTPRRPPAPRETPGPDAPQTSGRARKSPAPSKFPRKFGWLIPLLPLHEINSYRDYLDRLLGDPEMQALLAAAPVAMTRSIRSLCWMLRLPVPAVLARPTRPTAPQVAPSPPAASSAPPTDDNSVHRTPADNTYRPSTNWPRGFWRSRPPPKPKTV